MPDAITGGQEIQDLLAMIALYTGFGDIACTIYQKPMRSSYKKSCQG